MRPRTNPLPHGRRLEADFINETLSIYRDEHQTLREAAWDGTRLSARFDLTPYPFTKPGHIQYVTAAMAALYLSQAAYVLARVLVEEHPLLKHAGATLDTFFRARDAGDMTITRLNLKFRRKIAVSPRGMELEIQPTVLHQRLGRLFGSLAIDFEDMSCAGDALLSMPLGTPE